MHIHKHPEHVYFSFGFFEISLQWGFLRIFILCEIYTPRFFFNWRDAQKQVRISYICDFLELISKDVMIHIDGKYHVWSLWLIFELIVTIVTDLPTSENIYPLIENIKIYKDLLILKYYNINITKYNNFSSYCRLSFTLLSFICILKIWLIFHKYIKLRCLCYSSMIKIIIWRS